MLKIHFTVEDLLHVTVAERPVPLMELGLALMNAQRHDNPDIFGRWRAHIRQTLPLRARPMLELLSPVGTGPLFLDPPSTGLGDGLDTVLSTPRATALSELQRICAVDRPRTPWIRQLADHDRGAWRILEGAIKAAHHAVLGSSWPHLQAAFRAETAWRTRSLARHGLHHTLTSLAPGLRWNGMTLEVDSSFGREVFLTGAGVTLLPTLLWPGPVLVAPQPAGPALLMYPAITPLPLHDAPSAGDPLTALLGATRATALRTLTQPHTTTGLARALGITAPAASMQAKTLREAGLVTTHRDGKTVWHSTTPLGTDILATAAPG
ncbi:hypothetical protein ACZ90_18085 [Streptomyces albus subsp. albus]|nr:hypothetical protein ACZ90_18085 [Streptomyces albus subsp. albus]